MKKQNKLMLWIGLGLVALAGIVLLVYWYRNSKKTCPDGSQVGRGEPCPDETGDTTKGGSIGGGGGGGYSGGTGGGGICSSTLPRNSSKVLKKGVKSVEVCELQKWLGVGVDGIFGSQTEGALKSKTGKTQITLAEITGAGGGGGEQQSKPLKVGNAKAKVNLDYYDSMYIGKKRIGSVSKGNYVGYVTWIGKDLLLTTWAQVNMNIGGVARKVYVLAENLENY